MCKYSTDIKGIKERLKKVREKAGYSQQKLAKEIHVGDGGESRGRTTLTNWESTKTQTLPNLVALINICNLLEVDMDYILGASDIESQNTKTIADTVHISEKTVNTLKNNSEYGSMLDSIVNDNLFTEISNRIKQLGRNFVLEDVITTSFKSNFISLIRRKFNDFYFTTFPMDISPKLFVRYLTKQIPYSNEFNPKDFIEQNFLYDGKNFIYKLYENGKEEFNALDSYEKYKVIISSIAEISFDYFISLQTVELSKQRINLMFADIINNAIKQETEKVKTNMRLAAKS